MDVANLSMRVDSAPLARGRKELGRFSRASQDTTRAAGGAERAVGGLTAAFGGLSRYVGLATKAFGGLSVAMIFAGAVRESEQLQRNMLRTQAIIHATGGVAGRTAEQLHQQARSLAAATLASTEGVMQAQQTLLTFRNIRGEVFDQAIVGAMDLAAAMGQDLNSATLQLAKALEDPITGMTALTRSGTVFTEAQKDMVRGMVEAGRTMDAQAFILAELAAQYGGVAAKEAAGLAGAQDTLAQAVQEAKIELDAVLNLTGRLASGYRAVADAVGFLTANMERIVYYVGVAVVAFGTRFAVALAIAAARTATLSGALLFLRGALIRTGIGALVVGAGELAYQFSGLVRATGSFGEALVALKHVAIEAWQRIGDGVSYVGASIKAMAAGAAAYFIEKIRNMAGAWVDFTWAIADGMNALFGTSLRGADATITQDLARLQLDLLQTQNQAIRTANAASEAFSKPMGSIHRLRDVVSGAAEDTEDGASAAERLNDALGDIGGDDGGGGSGGAAAKAIEGAKTAAEGFSDAMKDAAITAEEMGQEKAGILVSGIDSISNAVGDFVATGFRDFRDFFDGVWKGFQSMIAQMVALAAKTRIMRGLGIGADGLTGTAAGLAESAGGSGGLLSGIFGSFGGGKGFMGGIGNAVSGGLGGIFSVGANALKAGGGFMATLGAAIPVLGIAAAALSLFIAKTKTLDAGLRVTVDGMDALVQSFSVIQKSRLFGLIKSTSTSASAAAAEIADPITAAIADIQDSVLTAAEALGIGADAFADFSTSVDISTAGMSREDAIQAVLEGLGAVADDMAEMVPGLTDVALTGETASATLTRLAADLGQVNAALGAIGVTVFEIGVEGAAAASEIVQALGGTDGFATAFNAFVQGFYSEAERLDMLTADLKAAFGDLGLVMPQTRVEFRNLVEGMDLTTSAGRTLYAEVLALASALDQALPSVEYLTAAVYGLVLDVSSDVDASIAAAEEAARASEQAAELWYRTSETLRDFLSDLLGSDLGGQSAFGQLSATEAQYAATLAAAQAGDAEAAAAFPAIAQDMLNAAMAVSATEQEYQQYVNQVVADTTLLAGISTLEGGIEDVLEDLYQEQIALLESLNAFLSYEGLSEEEIALLDESLQAFILDWDGTLAEFETALASVEAAITDVSALNYEAIQQDIAMSIDAIYAAEYDDATEAMLIAAVEGIAVSVDFILRQELPPDLMFLAVTAESYHLTSIDYIVGDNTLTDEEIALALAVSDEITKTISAVLSSDTTAAAMAIALASTAELARVIALTLEEGVDEELLTLALASAGTYLINIQMALAPDVSEELAMFVFEDAAAFALVVEAALDLSAVSPEEAILLLEAASIHALNVTLTLLTPSLTEAEQLLITEASSAALLAVTLTLIYPEYFTESEIAMLQEESFDVLMSIFATLAYPEGLTEGELELLQDAESSALLTIFASIDTDLSDAALSIVAIWEDADAILKTIDADVKLSAGALDQLFLDTWADVEEALKTIQADVKLSAGELDQVFLGIWEDAEAVAKTIDADVSLSAGSLDQDWLAALVEFTEITTRTIDAIIDIGSLTAEEEAWLLAITGDAAGTVTLAGGFVLDVSAAFEVWYETTTQDLITDPMADLAVSIDALQDAVAAQLYYMELDAIQAELAYLETVARAAETAESEAIVAEVEALEAATGVQLVNSSGGDANVAVNDAGNINYNAAAVSYSSTSDLDTFSDEYWSDGGLEDQILAQQQDVWDLNAEANALRNQITAMGGVPMYAAGGFHMGGLAIVGEEGPELAMFGGPSRIYSARDTGEMLEGMGGDAAEEVAALRDEVRQMLMAIAKNTRRTAQNTDEMVATGIPVRTEGTDTVKTTT